MGRNKENTINRLLQAARETIIFQGVDQIGITAIATRAGVNKVLVYRYFGGWNGIIETLFGQMLSGIHNNTMLVTALEVSPQDKFDNWEAYTLLFYQSLQSDPAFQILLRWQIDNHHTELARRLIRLLDESIQEMISNDRLETGMLRLLLTGVTHSVSTPAITTDDLTEQVIRQIFSQLKLASVLSEQYVEMALPL